MGKNYRTIPIGVLAATLALVYDYWDTKPNIVDVLLSIVSFAVITAIFSGIAECIIDYTEKQETVKGIVKISVIIVAVIFIFAFLVKSRM